MSMAINYYTQTLSKRVRARLVLLVESEEKRCPLVV